MDPLLYRPNKIPVHIIQEKVAQATEIPLDKITMSPSIISARKLEYTKARQISMTLCKKYTTHSLSQIGYMHGHRDHATVLHAVKTINNLIDTHDMLITDSFRQAEISVRKWYVVSYEKMHGLSIERRIALIKIWIRNKVPLYVRERILYGKICKECGQIIK